MTAFDALFVPASLREATSGRSWLQAMLEVERALASAGAAAGVIPSESAAAIAAACFADGYDWNQLLAEAHGAGTPAEPLVRALVARVGEEHARWVHFGATSQDVMDTAFVLVAREGLRLVRGELERVGAACATLARAHRDTPVAGRTLLQQAVPTTFGLKAAGWLVGVLDADDRLRELGDRLPAELGGAAGTLSALGDRGIEVSALFARELGLAESTVPWHANRVRVAELGAALEITAGVLAKIALDVQLLAQTEVGEVREGGEAGGSSAMPQKHNPVGSMWTRAGAALVRGHASVLVGSLAGEHERGAGSWQAGWEALSGALGTTGGAAAALAGALEGLEVNEARMRENLDRTGGLVVAERVALVLAERVGRTAARAVVRDASLRAAASGAHARRGARVGRHGAHARRDPRADGPDDLPRLLRCIRRPCAGTLRDPDGSTGRRLVSSDRDDTYAEGMEVRRAVLGDAHVDRAIERTTSFTEGFQDLITRYAWGDVWSRPGLDRRARSMITLTALVATGREHELEMHIRAALRNGLTPDEIGEVLLHCAVYCGVPAANGAFAIAQRVIDDGEDT